MESMPHRFRTGTHVKKYQLAGDARAPAHPLVPVACYSMATLASALTLGVVVRPDKKSLWRIPELEGGKKVFVKV